MTPHDGHREAEPLPARPRWVKVFAVVAGGLVLAFVVVHLLTGGGAAMHHG